MDFCRQTALAPGQVVRAHYDFADNGQMRSIEGVAAPTHKVVRAGRPVVFHYRVSHWVEAAGLMRFDGVHGRPT